MPERTFTNSTVDHGKELPSLRVVISRTAQFVVQKVPLMMVIIVLSSIVATGTACGAAAPAPLPTYTPHPTHTPAPTWPPLPTYTPFPTLASLPTYTPYPTHTPYPTWTPVPPPSPTPRPTDVPTPTPQPAPTPETWKGTGNWYRDTEYEIALRPILQAQGIDESGTFATLDADPDAWASDMSLTLGCLLSSRLIYLFPYSLSVASEVDTYVVGMWNDSTETWKDGEVHFYYNPVLTDDGSAIFIVNNAQIRQILDILRTADRNQNPKHAMNVGMYDSTDEDGVEFWSEFDPAGLQDALEYLDCY